jgi:putative transposase
MPWTKFRYHLVVSTKYRHEFLYGRLGQIAKRIGGHPFAVNGWHDHVHVLCALPPNKSVSECVAKLKSQSSGALRREYPAMKHFLWSLDYSALTFDHRRLSGIAHYVRNQKKCHGNQTTNPEWERTG